MSKENPWSIKTVNSFIEQYPLLKDHPYLSDRWHYENGCILKAIAEVYEFTGSQEYYKYIKRNMDTYVGEDGTIKGYMIEEYNLDQINQGKLLLFLYRHTQDYKYIKAARVLVTQLKGHPRTSEGGFWHKKIYPYQMWLDGLYMASPFLAEYAELELKPLLFDDVAAQLILVEKHTRNAQTGLLYHGWDESKEQEWANADHGCSPHVWGRAIGWYCMAVVDVLDYLPIDHKHRGQIIGIFERLYKALVRIQDEKTGLWCQVMGEEGRTGNYLEATGSAMIVYAGAKGLNKGYLSPGYRGSVERGYQGILEQWVEVDEHGHVHLHQNNKGAGLGGSPYRDGSYTYYIGEQVVSDDPKGLAPFILACVETEKAGRS